MSYVRAVFALVGGLFAFIPSPPTLGAEAMFFTPADLKWHPIGFLPNGGEIAVIQGPLDQERPFMYRIRYRAGWTAHPHWHRVAYHLTVLSGTFNLGMGDTYDKSKTRPLKTGTVALVPAGQHIFAWVGDNHTVVQIEAIGPWTTDWVNPKDDPASNMAK